jgi:tetratricopeptide (TPR) repeat protein
MPRTLIVAIVALLLAASPAAAQRRTAAELEKAGWEAIRANRAQEAAEAFGEAVRLQPGNVRLMLGAGLAAYLLGRAEEARQHLVAALEADPAITDASILLGQILYRDGDLNGAIQVYEQALTHAPKEALLATRLEAWRREADLHGRFNQKYGDHFTVLFEGPREETVAKHAIEMLEASYWRIGTTLGAYPNSIITIVLYTNEQFRDVTQSPDWAAAAFDGRIRVPMRGALENPAQLDRVLAHEGLAQMFESGQKADTASGRIALPLSRLEKSFAGLDKDQARAAYAQSASAVRALVDQAGTAAILNLLTFIAEGAPFDQAFERAAFISYAAFQQMLSEPAKLPLAR